jgi:hypothetical protein
MKWTTRHDRSGTPIGWLGRPRWFCVYTAVVLVGAVLAGIVLAGAQQAPQSAQQQAGSAPAHEPAQGAISNTTSAAVPSLQSGVRNPDAADPERKKQIAEESAILLKLATDLKAEVDKTTKDTLSLNVIRKADQIEKLAHNVKESMKPAGGPN